MTHTILPTSMTAFTAFCNHLRNAKISFALGGSALLAHHGLADAVADWDITTEDSEEKVCEALRSFRFTSGTKHPDFATSFNYKIQIESAVVDLMGGFAIRCGTSVCQMPTIVSDHWGNIPLASLEVWAVAYRLMGRHAKADCIFAFLQQKGAKGEIILQLLEQPLPPTLRLELATLPLIPKQRNASISFRPLTRPDLPLLQKWLAEPHVDQWWHQASTIEEVAEKYTPRIDGTEPTHVSIIGYEEQSIGWIQWYRWSDYREHAKQLEAESSAAGIDLAIGEIDALGKGLGAAVISEFLKRVVFAHPEITACVTDPEEHNTRSLRAFENAGFTAKKLVQLKGEQCRRWIVRRERPTQ